MAWTCLARPESHGSFLQSGIVALQNADPTFRSGVGRMNRFACPVCCVNGQPGHIRPAEITEAAPLRRQLQET